ncbi:MAG TPA: FGGY family carbohydrate kinase [Arachidicoccus sp.]|nr:FGGY family carbohydrate kinase [Arachidicoccus sp.]
MKKEAYLIVDIGTGNVRVALTETSGRVVEIARGDVHYITDPVQVDALHFNPDELWQQIIVLAKQVLSATPSYSVKAITASSQREGVVLLDKEGNGLIGMPNHDHRGRSSEHLLSLAEKQAIYRKAGRYPSSLFSAFKLIGIRREKPEIFKKTACMISISDWAQYQLSGVLGYEHAQASETLLYDVGQQRWSEELCKLCRIDPALLPPLHLSGTILGPLRTELASRWNLDPATPVIVGGADTQLALKSTQPALGDIALVAGTTTPIVMVTDHFITDKDFRTWTNRHVEYDRFVLEANAGVTGLNYQRLKDIFYPNESYSVIEAELQALEKQRSTPTASSDERIAASVTASLGSLVAQEQHPLTTGGFIFNVPVGSGLSRAQFVWAALWDIACCIKENYDVLCSVTPYTKDYVWGCSGGMQSKILRQFTANLIGKEIRMRTNHTQASVIGGAIICAQTMGDIGYIESATESTIADPVAGPATTAHYRQWRAVRSKLQDAYLPCQS